MLSTTKSQSLNEKWEIVLEKVENEWDGVNDYCRDLKVGMMGLTLGK